MTTRVMIAAGSAVLLFAAFGAGRGRSGVAARRARREELHNFPLYFWVSLGVVLAIGFGVAVVVGRRRQARTADELAAGDV